MQSDLFSDTTTPALAASSKANGHPEILNLDAEGRCYLCIYRGFYASRAKALFETLEQTIPWRQDTIRIAGKQMPIPRLQAWFGDPGAVYGYSGIQLTPVPFTDELLRIKEDLEALGDGKTRNSPGYNSLLANLYRDGNDSVGWHSDDEKELGNNPVIASVSLGDSRRFSLKPRDRSSPPQHIDLHDGDVLVMGGETQHHWIHQVPKTRKPVRSRINLTFRKIHVK